MHSIVLVLAIGLVFVYGNKTAIDEDRKFLLPMLAVKPLIAAGLLAGLKLPILPKPSLEFTITKHESANSSAQPITTTPTPQTTTSTPTQKPPATFPPNTIPPATGACSSLNGFPCYSVPSGCVCVVSTQKPWVDAFNYCRANGMSLISFQSVAKQAEFENYLPLLIGQNNIFTIIGFWTSGTFCLTTYTWASIPEYFTYTNWQIGEPDITNLPRASCVRAIPLDKYQWDDIDCGQFLPFICE